MVRTIPYRPFRFEVCDSTSIISLSTPPFYKSFPFQPWLLFERTGEVRGEQLIRNRRFPSLSPVTVTFVFVGPVSILRKTTQDRNKFYKQRQIIHKNVIKTSKFYNKFIKQVESTSKKTRRKLKHRFRSASEWSDNRTGIQRS